MDTRRQAEKHALEVSVRRADALLSAGNYQGSLSFLATIPMPFRSAPPLRERSAVAQGKAVDAQWAIIGSTAQLAARAQACRAIQSSVVELGNGLSDYASVSAAQIQTACAKVDAEEQRRVRLAEVAAAALQLRAAQTARAAEAKAAREAQAWSTAPLSCNDGSLSPSCVCGGLHRGCCSHHGGVAGCSVPR